MKMIFSKSSDYVVGVGSLGGVFVYFPKIWDKSFMCHFPEATKAPPVVWDCPAEPRFRVERERLEDLKAWLTGRHGFKRGKRGAYGDFMRQVLHV